jgi:hypothetical protein
MILNKSCDALDRLSDLLMIVLLNSLEQHKCMLTGLIPVSLFFFGDFLITSSPCSYIQGGFRDYYKLPLCYHIFINLGVTISFIF